MANNYLAMSVIITGLIFYGMCVQTGRPVSEINTGKKCECGAFDSVDSAKKLFEYNPINTTCDVEGFKKCKEICEDLAKLSEPYAAELVCGVLKDPTMLKVTLYVHVCEDPWVNTNLTTKNICCKDNKSAICEGDKNSTKNSLPPK